MSQITAIDWSEIDTILLDMDGTLLDLHFDNYFWLTHLPQRYAEHHNICPNQATTQLHQLFNAKRGTLEWYCLDYWSEQLAVDITELKTEIQHLIAERPFVHEFLDFMGSQHVQRILITNAHPESLKLKLAVTNIGPKLDTIISSHQFQQPKESPFFWQRLQKEIAFNPKTTVFIDDSAEILSAAQTFGIEHLVWISQPDSQQKSQQNLSTHSAITHFNELLPI